MRGDSAVQISTVAAHRNKIRWVSGFAVSTLGDHIFYVALGWAVATTESPGAVGLVLGAGAVPRAILMLAGGVLVDRFGARQVMLRCDGLGAIVTVGAALIATLWGTNIPTLVAISVLVGIVSGLAQPAIGVMPRFLVPPDKLLQLHGLRSFFYRLASVGGAPLGGLVIAKFGVAGAFALNSATFAVSFWMILGIRAQGYTAVKATNGQLGHSPAGYRAVLSDGLLRTLIFIIFSIELGLIGTLNVGIPVLVVQRDWGVFGLGLIFGGFGFGAAISALVVALAGGELRVRVVLVVSGLVAAIGTLGIAFSANLVLVVFLAATIGAAGAVMSMMTVTFAQLRSNGENQGRMMSLLGIASAGAAPFGSVLTGWFASISNISIALLINSAFVALTVVMVVTNSSIRKNKATHIARSDPDHL